MSTPGGAGGPSLPVSTPPADPARTGHREPPEVRPAPGPSLLARYWPVAIPAAVMLALGLWGLARDQAMGNDEVASRWAALLSLRELARLLRHVDAVHGLYYLVMHAWVVVGSSPTALRVPSVLSMIIAVALVAVLGRRLTGSALAGVLAGLIMALTPTISFYAQTARSYAMVVGCVAAATLVLVRALGAEAAGDRRAPRWWMLYALLIALGGYLNEMSLLVLAAHAVTVLLARYGRAAATRWLIAAVCGGALVLPVLALSVAQHAAVSWITRPDLTSLRVLFHDYFGATILVGLLVLGCAVIAVLPALALDRTPGTENAGRPVAWWRSGGLSLPSVAAPLLVLPAGLLLIESLAGPPLYVDRYVLYGEAGAALLAGAGACRLGQWLARGRWPGLLVVPGALLCACALLLQLGPQQRARTPQSRAYNFGGPSAYLGTHARPGDGVMYFGNFFRKAELGYPADFRKVTDFAAAQSPLQAGTFRGTDKPFSQAGPLMLRYNRIWVIGQSPSLQLPPGLLRQESGQLIRYFRPAGSWSFKGITVTLWQRR